MESQTQTRARAVQRRSLLMALLIAGVGIITYQTTTQSWYKGAFVTNDVWTWVPLNPELLATAGVVPTPTGPVPALYTVFGYAAPTAWIVAAVGLGLLAVATRLGVLALFGAGAVWMARGAADGLQTALTSSADVAGRFVIDGSALPQFMDWVWVLMVVLVLTAMQITYAGHVRRRAALEAGEEVDHNMLDTFHSLQTSAMSRMTTAGKTGAPTSGTATSSSTT